MIAGYPAMQFDGMEMRLFGYGEPPELVADTDVSAVDSEWVIHKALSVLYLNGMIANSRSQNWASLGILHEQKAQEIFPRLIMNLDPNAERI